MHFLNFDPCWYQHFSKISLVLYVYFGFLSFVALHPRQQLWSWRDGNSLAIFVLNFQWIVFETKYRPIDLSTQLKITFIISQPKNMLWVLKRTVSLMLRMKDKKIFTILWSNYLIIFTKVLIIILIISNVYWIMCVGRSCYLGTSFRL